MFDVLLDALIDSLKVLAVLVVVYIIIGLLEGKVTKVLSLKNKWTPVVAVGLASLPQCGLSVVATDLYQKRRLSAGLLIGVYLATSDEALPIMLSHPEKAISVLPLLAIKIVVGVLSCYVIDALYKPKVTEEVAEPLEDEHNEEEENVGCCKHKIGKGKQLEQYLLHPLVHSLKIFAYILVINMVFGTGIYFIGEDAIIRFMEANRYVAPLYAIIVGLIPNCVSSVILTDMYLLGGIGFGACVGGLCANAGIALTVLFKKKADFYGNIKIVGILVAISLIVGYAVSAVYAFN
jgi:Protein of unknown function (DUF2899).